MSVPASKGAAVLFIAVHLLLLLQRAAMQEEDQEEAIVGPTLNKGLMAGGAQARAAGAQLQAASETLPLPEKKLGDCAPPLGTCRSRGCCDEKNFGCARTEIFGFVVAATCRPLSTCDANNACTLNLKRIRGTLLPPHP